jgi:hypothetical protein
MSPGVPRGGCNRIPLLSKRRLCISRVVWGLRSGPPRFTLLSLGNKEDDQWPGQPQPSLRSASASRSTGICRPNSDSDPFGSVTRRPGILLADMPFGMGRGRTGAAGEVGCGQARFQLPSLWSRSSCHAELPAWLLPDERYRRSSSRIARLRLGAPSEITYPVKRPVYRAVAMPNRCACQRRWLSINVEMKK